MSAELIKIWAYDGTRYRLVKKTNTLPNSSHEHSYIVEMQTMDAMGEPRWVSAGYREDQLAPLICGIEASVPYK